MILLLFIFFSSLLSKVLLGLVDSSILFSHDLFNFIRGSFYRFPLNGFAGIFSIFLDF